LKCHRQGSDNNEVDENVDVGITILNACESDHFVRFLVIRNEDDVSNEDKENKITDQYIDFLWEAED
jgi:hypothetical protein